MPQSKGKVMICQFIVTGIYFYFTNEDWKLGDVRGMQKELNKLGVEHKPPEKPDTQYWYRLDNDHRQTFLKLRETYIDWPKKAELSLKEEGYKPTPTVNRKFARAWLRY